jgi:hypothetical protein
VGVAAALGKCGPDHPLSTAKPGCHQYKESVRPVRMSRVVCSRPAQSGVDGPRPASELLRRRYQSPGSGSLQVPTWVELDSHCRGTFGRFRLSMGESVVPSRHTSCRLSFFSRKDTELDRFNC